MKKTFFPLIILIFCIYACQGKPAGGNEEKDLRQRFSGLLNAVSEMNIDSIQSYTYPKLFTVLPLSESSESMKRSYDYLKGKKAELDSVKIDSLYPIFHVDKGSYAKIVYSMVIRMPLDSTEIANKASDENATRIPADSKGPEHTIGTDHYPAPQSTLLATLMKNDFGVDFTRLEEKDGMRIIQMRVMAIAIKDEYAKEWSFFTITNDQELINKLFSKKVLEKLASKD